MTILRKCTHCGVEAHTKDEINNFCKEKDAKYGRRNLCYSCNRIRETKWRDANRDKIKIKSNKHHAEKVYKITLEEYHKRMATSDKCEVCGSKDNLCYDHCHDTLAFRGVLCNKCNRSIGQLGDTTESIKKVLAYLTKEK